MQKQIQLSELQLYKLENNFLKEKMIQRDLEELKKEQGEVIREIYPEFNGRTKCTLDPIHKLLIIDIPDSEIKEIKKVRN